MLLNILTHFPKMQSKQCRRMTHARVKEYEHLADTYNFNILDSGIPINPHRNVNRVW